MLTTLNGMFSKPKPYKIDFIKENKRKLKELSSMVHQNSSSRSRLEVTKSKNSQTEISRSISSSTAFKENRNMSSSKSRLSAKGSMAVFMHEKKDKGSISNVSLSTRRKSSHNNKVTTTKSQCCQTIDPRKYDQLFFDGVIKYPSNKVMQELAEIEKQKANRLDVHVKKEFFKRNRVKQKGLNKIKIPKAKIEVSEKGDVGGNEKPSEEEEYEEEDEEEEEDEQEEQENNKEPEPLESSVNLPKSKASPSPLRMCAAEIIRQTTENINSPRRLMQSDHVPSNKGDSKAVKKSQRLTREDEILKTVLDPHCPVGHIPLPDTERKKTLHMLRVSHAELVREMNLLPVRTDTLRVRQKKMQLEAQLNKIEEGIKVFNKSRVYVKIEE